MVAEAGGSPFDGRRTAASNVPPPVFLQHALSTQVMAHMGAPHTFAATSASYSTAFLFEMFVLAATFKIEVTTFYPRIRYCAGSGRGGGGDEIHRD